MMKWIFHSKTRNQMMESTHFACLLYSEYYWFYREIDEFYSKCLPTHKIKAIDSDLFAHFSNAKLNCGSSILVLDDSMAKYTDTHASFRLF